MSRRLALVGALPEAVRAAEVSVQVATQILVPLARANADACERSVRGLNGERVSVRQMTRLYKAWKASDDEVREPLREHPASLRSDHFAAGDHDERYR